MENQAAPEKTTEEKMIEKYNYLLKYYNCCEIKTIRDTIDCAFYYRDVMNEKDKAL